MKPDDEVRVTNLDGDGDVDTEEIAETLRENLGHDDDFRETLERIESAVETIEERTGAIDRTLEDLNR